ncbi:YkgJ family cysteine cluster protein [Zavarzinia compransoris]|uniref:YkgJ family cysteine cluster protein n=1 Tax=Zavarzinia compransoris TaxID=1264899 RepID=UPI0010F16DE9|nr:YkgJ family cysteine cluster protein [Zavarzinia compransoris]TDP47796.1 hypothetical protein DES42_10292 [Zavarzinia compransoris]
MEHDGPAGAPASPLALMRQQMAAADDRLRAGLAAARDEADIIAIARDLLALCEAVAADLAGLAPVKPLACRAGCDLCCRNLIQVRPLFAVLAAAEARATFPPAQFAVLLDRVAGGTDFCPFLFDGRCSIYHVRPMVCRGYYSLDFERCREGDYCEKGLGYQGDGGHAAHQSMVFLFALEKRIEAIEADLGLAPGLVLLDRAVRTLLAEPDATARWLAGEAVFTATGDPRLPG